MDSNEPIEDDRDLDRQLPIEKAWLPVQEMYMEDLSKDIENVSCFYDKKMSY